MSVRSRSRQRRWAPAAGGRDLISGLGDDVLVRVLELLTDTRDAVRTGALSRRWRGLWTRAATLSFDSGSRRSSKSASGSAWFLAFVNDTLAQRERAMTDAALEHLAISFVLDYPVGQQAQQLASVEATQGWIWYALQRAAVKSLVLDLRLPTISRGNGGEEEEEQVQSGMDLSHLPSSGALETMRLKLAGARIQLPASAAFTSLVDLSLEEIELAGGSAPLLSRLLSSACCPRLQKLKLTKIKLRTLNEIEVLIEAGALLELCCDEITGDGWNGWNGLALELRTPSLRVLRVLHCYTHALWISAPRLEELVFDYQPDQIHVDGELQCVRSLKVVELESHAQIDDFDGINDVGIRLLRCCTSLTCLEVSLDVLAESWRAADHIKLRIPHLPHVISLTVSFIQRDTHSFGIGVADILMQCSNLQYLRVHCYCEKSVRSCLCDHLDQWKSHEMYLLEIKEVEFTGLVGTDCQCWFMQRVLTHATQLQKVTLTFDTRCNLKVMPTNHFGIIPSGGGTWTSRQEASLSYQWKPSSL